MNKDMIFNFFFHIYTDFLILWPAFGPTWIMWMLQKNCCVCQQKKSFYYYYYSHNEWGNFLSFSFSFFFDQTPEWKSLWSVVVLVPIAFHYLGKTYFKISPFVFHRRKYVVQVWKDDRMFIFGWTFPFRSVIVKCILHVARLFKPSWLSAQISTDSSDSGFSIYSVFTMFWRCLLIQ